jgi:hypothetical protein
MDYAGTGSAELKRCKTGVKWLTSEQDVQTYSLEELALRGADKTAGNAGL